MKTEAKMNPYDEIKIVRWRIAGLMIGFFAGAVIAIILCLSGV